jgi:Ca2+-binding RTX toxin-like protein
MRSRDNASVRYLRGRLQMKGRLLVLASVVLLGLALSAAALAAFHRINGTNGPDTIIGTGAADLIHSFAGADTVDAEGGNDRIRGGSGPDRLLGGGGDDFIRGNAGNDLVQGGDGNDVLYVGRGLDQELGGPGNDRLHALANDNRVDTVDCGDGNDVAFENAKERDVFVNCETVITKMPTPAEEADDNG